MLYIRGSVRDQQTSNRALCQYAFEKANKPAVICQEEGLSYNQLHQKVGLYSNALFGLGVRSGDVIAVSIDRNVELLPLLLAIWSLRAAYIPVDPSYPNERKQYILNDASVNLMICDQSQQLSSFCDDNCVTLQTLKESAEPFLAPINCQFHTDDLAYIIYTSGSTGDPKGVAVTQGNVQNFLSSMEKEPGISEQDRLLAVTTISFDIHVLELFLPIWVGASLVLATRDEARMASSLIRIIDEQQCSVLQATPSTWRMLLQNNWAPKNLLKGLIGGEALPEDLLPDLHRVTHELWNMYGPTETTVWSTCCRLHKNDTEILIGKAIQNTQLYIVDEQLNPVDPGQKGELLIGGAGVAVGYWQKNVLTKKKFVNLPHLAKDVLYRTGDLVQQADDGSLKYVNRIDGQIKLRGFRIEPGDIEFAVQASAEVKQSVVVLVDLGAEHQCLVCCYLGEANVAQDLKTMVRQKLPAYMVPQHFLHFEEFPKTDNLKINRRALAEAAKQRINATQITGVGNARSNLDRCVIGIWEDVLKVNGISIDDDFFALGGHSLLALHAIKLMQTATGIEFSPDVIFTSPTIREILDHPVHEKQSEVIVAKLNNAIQGTPVYMLCGMRIYMQLASQFGEDRPLYCVFGKQEIALLDCVAESSCGKFDNQKFLQAYVSAILRQHKGGPIIIGGFSFGGVLALEAAHELSRLGVEVKNVILIDSYRPKSVCRSLTKIIHDVKLSVQHKGFWGSLNSAYRRTMIKLQLFNHHDDMSAISEKEREEVFDLAAENFESSLSEYQGNVQLHKAQFNDFGFGMCPSKDYGWKNIIKGQFTICEHPTDHTGIMAGEGVARLHDCIASYLEQHQA